MENALANAMQQHLDETGRFGMQASYVPIIPAFVSRQPWRPGYNQVDGKTPDVKNRAGTKSGRPTPSEDRAGLLTMTGFTTMQCGVCQQCFKTPEGKSVHRPMAKTRLQNSKSWI